MTAAQKPEAQDIPQLEQWKERVYTQSGLDAAVAEAVAMERERCAKVCEEAARLSGDMSMQWAWDACAAEIRNPKDAP